MNPYKYKFYFFKAIKGNKIGYSQIMFSVAKHILPRLFATNLTRAFRTESMQVGISCQ